MRPLVFICSLFIIGILGVHTASAQRTIPASKVTPYGHTLVRITAPSLSNQSLIGELNNFSVISVSITREQRHYSIPWDAIQEIEVGQPTSFARKGGLIGVVVGGFTMALLATDKNGQCEVYEIYCAASSDPLNGAVLGALAGGVLGMSIGHMFKTVRWEPLAFHVSSRPKRDGFGISASRFYPGLSIRWNMN
jgi:hypothetical protein